MTESRPLVSVSAEPLPKGEVTRLLRGWSSGEVQEQDRLFELVYPELKALAKSKLRLEPYPSSLQLTDLVHETYLRLVDQSQADWQCRAQFFALAATMVRRVLVDRARRRQRSKRGDGARPVPLELDLLPSEGSLNVDVIALDEALIGLKQVQALAAQIVELRYFAGQSVDETAEILGVGRATVVRKWRFAKAWLAGHMEGRT